MAFSKVHIITVNMTEKSAHSLSTDIAGHQQSVNGSPPAKKTIKFSPGTIITELKAIPFNYLQLCKAQRKV